MLYIVAPLKSIFILSVDPGVSISLSTWRRAFTSSSLEKMRTVCIV